MDEIGKKVATTADVAERAGITVEAARRFLKGILDEVALGREVHLTGYGQFRTSAVRGKAIRSPILPDGEVRSSDKVVLRFCGSKLANDYLNGRVETWKCAGKEVTE